MYYTVDTPKMGRNGPRKKHPTLGVYDSSGDTPKMGRNQYMTFLFRLIHIICSKTWRFKRQVK